MFFSWTRPLRGRKTSPIQNKPHARPQLVLERLEDRQLMSRNVLIFVADGLRAGSVNPTDAPTLYSIQQQGVDFANSHALFPTFTTPNASAIATGHLLGDTGDFSNTVFTGFPVFNDTSFTNPPAPAPGTNTPFVENDQILGDIDEHFPNQNFLDEESLLAFARQNGYDTAAVGKLGPVLIQDVTQGNPQNGSVPPPQTVIIDDRTGTAAGVPLTTKIQNALTGAGLATAAPDRSNGQPANTSFNNGFSGNNTTPGTLAPNLTQQQYFTDAITKAVLPTFVTDVKPFALVYWARDPDGTQHNQGDSLNSLTPGINGPTSKNAIHNTDNNLTQLLNYLKATNDPQNPGHKLIENTDVFITADHGFSTISRHDLDNSGANFTTSYAAGFTYKDSTGRQEVNSGFLPPGFVALDIAHTLNLPLFDADNQVTIGGAAFYERVDPTIAQAGTLVNGVKENQHPANGDGLIGGTGKVQNVTDAQVVVAANGGSDLIYVPSKDPALTARIVDFLTKQDYISGVFVDDAIGTFPGALPLSAIGLKGSSQLPTPSIVINFRTFSTNPADPINSEVEIADTGLQEGQGMHGNFGRGDTFNNMAAIGPDFKKGFVDQAPISNADLTPTLASVLGFNIPSVGTLKGRVLSEALVGGPASVPVTTGTLYSSTAAANGQSTILKFQKAGGETYFDEAGFAGRTVGLPALSSVAPVVFEQDLYGPHPNPDANTAYVHGLYRAILGRDADAAGLNGWVAALANGTRTRAQVAQSIWESDEHRGQEVDGYYRAFLHRASDAAGRAGWIATLKSSGGESAVIAGFLISSEYTAAHKSSDAFVNSLYADVLSRSSESTGFAAHKAELDGGVSRLSVAQAFLNSPESFQIAVGAYYNAYLHRDGSAAEVAPWVNMLNGGTGSFESVATSVLASDEFFAHAKVSVP